MNEHSHGLLIHCVLCFKLLKSFISWHLFSFTGQNTSVTKTNSYSFDKYYMSKEYVLDCSACEMYCIDVGALKSMKEIPLKKCYCGKGYHMTKNGTNCRSW